MTDVYEKKILIVDDEPALQRLVKEILLKEGFARIATARDCAQALEQFSHWKPDLVLLDVTLPDGDGFQLMRKFRTISFAPVLFLTARDEGEDRLLGLGLGADDYITKPFLPKELVLRVAAVLRRTYSPLERQTDEKPVFMLGPRRVDFNSGTVEGPEGVQTLTAKEFVLLKKLYENRGKIVTSDCLCEAAWNDLLYGYENTLMVHIRRIREKIEEDPSKPAFLLTVRGLGYKLVTEDSHER